MSQLITIGERPVQPKGLNKSARPKNITAYVFEEDYENLKLLKPLNVQLPDNPVLLYPGCSADVILPLEYVERLCSPKHLHCIFIDKEQVFNQIATVLDDIGISFEKYKQNKNTLRFYWNDMLVQLDIITADIFQIIHSLKCDIYFERAFRIMKSGHAGYEAAVFTQLSTGGLLISDSGYQNSSLKKFPVAQELSAYKEMIIGRKLT